MLFYKNKEPIYASLTALMMFFQELLLHSLKNPSMFSFLQILEAAPNKLKDILHLILNIVRLP
jgi:hypothetical protein